MVLQTLPTLLLFLTLLLVMPSPALSVSEDDVYLKMRYEEQVVDFNPIKEIPTIYNNAMQQGSLIFLHGRGGDGRDYHSLFEPLSRIRLQGAKMLFPTATERRTKVGSHKMIRMWYGDGNGDAEVAQAMQSVAAIHKLLDQEIASGVAPEKILVMGHAQGGTLALMAAFSYPKRLGGVMVVAASLLQEDHFRGIITEEARKTPLLWLQGGFDNFVPLEDARVTFRKLQAMDLRCQFQIDRENQHFIGPDMFEKVIEFMKKTFKIRSERIGL